MRAHAECVGECRENGLVGGSIDGPRLDGDDEGVFPVTPADSRPGRAGLDPDGDAEVGHGLILPQGIPGARRVFVWSMSASVVPCPSCAAKNRVPAVASGRPRCAKCATDLPWVADATDATFSAATTTGSLVLVDLWAPWCGPCRMVAPVLERLAARYPGRLKVVKVNVDDNPRIARDYDASSIPTLVMLKDGKVVGRVVGAQPEHVLAQQIEPLLPSV